MKKCAILLIAIFLLTGCKAEYQLSINNDLYDESLEVYVDKDINRDVPLSNAYNMTYNDIFDTLRNKDIFVDFNDDNGIPFEDVNANYIYYNRENIDTNNRYGVKYSYSFNNDYYKSNIVKDCYDEITISKSEDLVIIKTSDKCHSFDNYPLLEEVKVVFNLKGFETIYSNADEKNSDSLVWIINRSNYTNKKISLTVDTNPQNITDSNDNKDIINDETKDDDRNNKENKVINNSVLLILGVILFVVGLAIIIKIKTKRL